MTRSLTLATATTIALAALACEEDKKEPAKTARPRRRPPPVATPEKKPEPPPEPKAEEKKAGAVSTAEVLLRPREGRVLHAGSEPSAVHEGRRRVSRGCREEAVARPGQGRHQEGSRQGGDAARLRLTAGAGCRRPAPRAHRSLKSRFITVRRPSRSASRMAASMASRTMSESTGNTLSEVFMSARAFT